MKTERTGGGEPCVRKRRDASPYATNSLIVKVGEDPVTGVQNPPRETICLAKEAVDDNEK